jgi:hypothetical protein
MSHFLCPFKLEAITNQQKGYEAERPEEPKDRDASLTITSREHLLSLFNCFSQMLDTLSGEQTNTLSSLLSSGRIVPVRLFYMPVRIL